jgi:hypothetical protein
MKHRIIRSKRLAAIAIASLALVACSRADNGDGLTDAQREDQAASASVTGLVNFAAGKIDTATNETTEPRSIAGITPPADETSEPFVL